LRAPDNSASRAARRSDRRLSANGVAALALARGLIRKLKNKGIIDQDDINSIVDDALIQIKTLGTAGANEARQVIKELTQS
jgi:hypothetical protein